MGDEPAAIVLVPGFFGFSRIGEIHYFEKVVPLLSAASGVPREHVSVVHTLPTAAFERRVRALYDEVALQRRRFARVHLVGHSTGGVDIRLLANDAYLWPGGPRGAERTAVLGGLGRLVSIASPHRGTPIADRLGGLFPVLVPLLSILSLAADAERGRRWRRTFRPVVLACAGLIQGLDRGAGIERVLLLAGVSPRTAKAASAFLTSVARDHEAARELTVAAMQARNESIAAGRQLPLSSYVTVAPPPWSLARRWPPRSWLTPLQAGLYAASYACACPAPSPFPAGPWIGDARPSPWGDLSRAEDGVVPAASQTMSGAAEGIVYGDHLDVVGHYEGEHGGETVFDSGADFDDARMTALWTAIGEHVRAWRPSGAPA